MHLVKKKLDTLVNCVYYYQDLRQTILVIIESEKILPEGS